LKKSIFEPLIREGLTTLEIRYEWKKDETRLFAAKDWNDEVKWSRYNKDFTVESLLINDGVYLNNTQVNQLFVKYELEDYLKDIVNLLKKGRHMGISCFYYKKKDIRFMANMHNVVCGINNRSHAIRSGGIRRHEPEAEEFNVIIDGLNLARAMSFKNVAAGIPFGGCKTTVQSNQVDLTDMEEVGFLSYAVDRSRSFTGPDMNYPIELADVMKKHFTVSITGGIKGPLGPTGTPTAYGTYLAVKQAAKFKFGSDSLAGKKIAVQGLGACGFVLAEYYIKEGAKLFVGDLNEDVIKDLTNKYPDKDITVVEKDDIYFVDADIFSPAASGGVITEERIPKMKFSIIMGPANNQLKASSQEEEYKMAKLLEKHNILYQCDWWHNMAGVLAGWEEYINQDKADLKRLYALVEKICPQKTWDNLNKAKQLGITPSECAYQTVEKIIYGD
jgi:glutamate dehydrogenase/leucine dehydrogenase